MILGIGTDIAAVGRLRTMWERHGERALDHLLAPAERADFERAADKGRFLAKRFAAKEAFAKAFGTGIRAPVLLTAIAIVHDELGKPGYAFCGPLEKMVKNRDLAAHLSISDEADYAVAFCILESA